MKSPVKSDRAEARVLVVIPGGGNYFYNLYARWMAQEFRILGLSVELCELRDVPAGRFDLCILSNVVELLYTNGSDEGRKRIDAVRHSADVVVNFSAECVHTQWFRGGMNTCRELGIDHILDVGFLHQDDGGARRAGMTYHFVFDGLTLAQAREVGAASRDDGPRIIPWAHVGMHTRRRVELSDRLIEGIAPNGLIFLPEVSPIKEQGSPNLNHEQMERILKRTEYYVWCSHHDHFYMESLRFRMAALTGCIPIKVVGDNEELPADLPFATWVFREGELIARLSALRFEEARSTFGAEYLRQPRLVDGLGELLDSCGYPVEGRARDRLEPPAEAESIARCA